MAYKSEKKVIFRNIRPCGAKVSGRDRRKKVFRRALNWGYATKKCVCEPHKSRAKEESKWIFLLSLNCQIHHTRKNYYKKSGLDICALDVLDRDSIVFGVNFAGLLFVGVSEYVAIKLTRIVCTQKKYLLYVLICVTFSAGFYCCSRRQYV